MDTAILRMRAFSRDHSGVCSSSFLAVVGTPEQETERWWTLRDVAVTDWLVDIDEASCGDSWKQTRDTLNKFIVWEYVP